MMICRVLVPLIVLATLWGTCLPAGAGQRHRTAPDLFYNYYVPPVGPGAVGAELYPCPRPTPPLVGHTYVTYQPLMPHEFLYPHGRTYCRVHADGSRTVAHVRWTHDWDLLGWLKRPPEPVNTPRWGKKCSGYCPF